MSSRVVLDPSVPFVDADPLWVFASSGIAVVLPGASRLDAPNIEDCFTAELGAVAFAEDARELEWRGEEGLIAVTREGGDVELTRVERFGVGLAFGSVEPLDDAAEPAWELTGRLEDALTGPLLDALHARALAAIGRSVRFATDVRWSAYVPGDLIELRDVMHDLRLDLFELPGGRFIQAEMAFCVVPACPCKRFAVRFYDVPEGEGDDHDDEECLGMVDSPLDPTNDPEGPELDADPGEEATIAEAWAAFRRRYPSFEPIAERHRQLRAWAAPFVQRILDGAPRPKVGRNAPCPCGSGKKYKRCCWLTDAELEGSVAGFRAVP